MTIPLAKTVGRVPSMTVPLDHTEEERFGDLLESLTMVDMHQHPIVFPENLDDCDAYFRSKQWTWGYEAIRAGGWNAVGSGNFWTCIDQSRPGRNEPAFLQFYDLVDEIALMLADIARQPDVVTVSSADDIVAAKERGMIGLLPTVEHLGIGWDLYQVDVLYGLGVRTAGLTDTRNTHIGGGQDDRVGVGLSEFGIEVVQRMNDVGMIIDLSHASVETAYETIKRSKAPVMFSHNASGTLWPSPRTRADADYQACAEKGGLVCVLAVPNSLSDDPVHNIGVVLDHYDHFIELLGDDHVAIGSCTTIGDQVGITIKYARPDLKPPTPYLDGLESPADGKNIIRGLISRGHSDETIRKVAGENALAFMRRVVS
jgi:membrane dipeptidase